jgi:hypothetical protein
VLSEQKVVRRAKRKCNKLRMEYLQCHEMEMLLGLGWQEVELYIGVKLHKIAIYNLMYSKNFTVMII